MASEVCGVIEVTVPEFLWILENEGNIMRVGDKEYQIAGDTTPGADNHIVAYDCYGGRWGFEVVR